MNIQVCLLLTPSSNEPFKHIFTNAEILTSLLLLGFNISIFPSSGDFLSDRLVLDNCTEMQKKMRLPWKRRNVQKFMIQSTGNFGCWRANWQQLRKKGVDYLGWREGAQKSIVIQLLSCLTLCSSMDCSIPFPYSSLSSEFAQTHVIVE